MLSNLENIPVKVSENRCKKFLHFCLGGMVGMTSAIVMPAAQWLLNIRDKFLEKKPNARLRWPAILDVGASAVVAYGAVARFGNPALWVICLVEGCLACYGFVKGIQITRESGLIEVPKQLWNYKALEEIDTSNLPDTIFPDEPKNDSISLNCSKRTCNVIIGSLLGIGAGVGMPIAQSIKYIHSMERRWPPLINGGVLTSYALYVGSIYLGPQVSLVLLKRVAQTLGVYGVIRGGYIGYKEKPSKVFTVMWNGGFNMNHPIKIANEEAKDVALRTELCEMGSDLTDSNPSSVSRTQMSSV